MLFPWDISRALRKMPGCTLHAHVRKTVVLDTLPWICSAYPNLLQATCLTFRTIFGKPENLNPTLEI